MAVTANTVRMDTVRIIGWSPLSSLQPDKHQSALCYSGTAENTLRNSGIGGSRSLRQFTPHHAAPCAEVSDGAGDDIEHRREDQAERRHPDHAKKHCRAERLAQFRTGAD